MQKVRDGIRTIGEAGGQLMVLENGGEKDLALSAELLEVLINSFKSTDFKLAMYLTLLLYSLSILLKALFLGRYLQGFGIGLTHPVTKSFILNIVLLHLKQGKPCKH